MPGQEVSAAVLLLRISELIGGSIVSPDSTHISGSETMEPHNGGTISPSNGTVRSNGTNDTSHIDGATGADAMSAADGAARVNGDHVSEEQGQTRFIFVRRRLDTKAVVPFLSVPTDVTL